MSARRTAAAGLAVTLLSGCGFEGAQSIPLPGGEGTGDDAYKVTVEFTDVLDLVPQSAVKVDDVTVGSVESIELDGYTARVVTRINDDVELPANVTAALRQTSLLGEKFVAFERPEQEQATGRLRGGETIGLDRTERSAEIEEVLGALSLVLNGGSIEQLQVINTELVNALEGRESDVKQLLSELNTFVGGLDAQKEQIVRALDSLDRLTARLAGERDVIATALEDIPPGVAVLSEQREQITQVLTALDDLGDVAVRVIQGSQQNTRASLEALRPVLANLNAAGDDFPRSLELLTTYPFPKTVDQGIKGDYANLFVTADFDLAQILQAETGIELPLGGAQAPGAAPQAPAAVPPVAPTAPAVPALPLPVPQLPSGLPPVQLDDVVEAPASSGLGGLLDRLRPNAKTSGGLLGLLVGGLQ